MTNKIWLDLDRVNDWGSILYAVRQCTRDLKSRGRPRLAFALLFVYRELRREHPESGFGPLYFDEADRRAHARDFIWTYDECALIRAYEMRERLVNGGWRRMVADWDKIHRHIAIQFRARYPELSRWMEKSLSNEAVRIGSASLDSPWMPCDMPKRSPTKIPKHRRNLRPPIEAGHANNRHSP
jgi:hypothetical protein